MRKRIQQEGILFQAYSSLGTQWKMKGYDPNPVLTHPTIVAIAQNHHVSVAQVIVNWGTRHGMSMIPASSNQGRQYENLHAFDFDLTDAEMRQMDALDGEDPSQVSITFQNRGTEPVESYWVSTDSNKEEVHVGSIQAGSVLSLSSFHGHKFVFRDGGGSVVGEHTVHKKGGPTQRHVVVHGEL